MDRQTIERRFDSNIDRVTALTTLYEGLLSGRGRPSLESTDVLRSAVVLLHAALEEVMRSLLLWKLPTAEAHNLEGLPLAGLKDKKFTLSQLAVFRGSTVDDVLEKSVAAHLHESNFNHPGDIHKALQMIGLPTTHLEVAKPGIAAMMRRRHWIAHRADSHGPPGSGIHAYQPLRKDTVVAWRSVVRDFIRGVLGEC